MHGTSEVFFSRDSATRDSVARCAKNLRGHTTRSGCQASRRMSSNTIIVNRMIRIDRQLEATMVSQPLKGVLGFQQTTNRVTFRLLTTREMQEVLIRIINTWRWRPHVGQIKDTGPMWIRASAPPNFVPHSVSVPF